MKKKLYIIGTKIDDLSISQALNKIQEHLLLNEKNYIVTPNPEICLKAYQDKQLRRTIKQSLIAIPDGFGLKIGAKIFGHKLNNITTGVDLTLKLLELAEHNNYSVLFFDGITQIGDSALKNIKQKFPKLKITYLDPGKVDNKGQTENKQLIEQINKFQPDIVFVNFGAPKQEYFIKNNLAKLNTKLMIGNGGSLDFISGRLKRAPKIMRKLGLEWLYRLFQEPVRIKRIFKAVVVFPLACLKFKLNLLTLYRNNAVAFIINNQKQILIAKHATDKFWQLPQGGAKNAKTNQEYEQAIIREMKQELGTTQLKPIKVLNNCYKYDFLPHPDNDWDHFKGQRQALILLEFTGKDSDIKLDRKEHLEWQWIRPDQIFTKVTRQAKVDLIKIGLTNFKDYI